MVIYELTSNENNAKALIMELTKFPTGFTTGSVTVNKIISDSYLDEATNSGQFEANINDQGKTEKYIENFVKNHPGITIKQIG